MTLLELLTTAAERKIDNHFKIFGAVTGIVQDIKDPAGLGRVKVDFPWLAKEKEDTASIEKKDTRAHSYWARIALLMAGPNRGTYFVPEVNDEVLVVFEHGELDRPYIIGILWNVDDKPPEKMDSAGKNDIRAIHTRSGHKVIFNDSKDKPSITIKDNTGQNFIEIDSKKNDMTLKVAGDITIDAGGNITIKAGQEIKIDAGTNLEAKAAQNGTLEAGMKLGMKSKTISSEADIQSETKGKMVSVNGSGVTEIKGGIVKIN